MSSDTNDPAIALVASYPSGGIQPDSSVLHEYARAPHGSMPNSAPASKIASRIRSKSSYGPHSSRPGAPPNAAPRPRAGGPRHAVPQRADLLAGDREGAQAEELDLLQRAAVQLL